jgi:hypothetical protein
LWLFLLRACSSGIPRLNRGRLRVWWERWQGCWGSDWISIALTPNFKGQCRPPLMSRLRFSSSSSYLQSLAQIILYNYTNMMEETKWNMMQLLESKFVTDPPNCERLPSSGASIIKTTKLLNHIDLQHHRSVTQIPERRLYSVYIYTSHLHIFKRRKTEEFTEERECQWSWLHHGWTIYVGMCGSSYHICTQIAIWIVSQKCQFWSWVRVKYVKCGACFSKSRECFTHTNILHYNYMILMIF